MEKLTYRSTLKKLRQQAINVLEGRYVDNVGTHGNTNFSADVECYGCEYVFQQTGKECSTFPEIDCPVEAVAQRIRALSVCWIDNNDPKQVFKAIQVIDKMLEELNVKASKS